MGETSTAPRLPGLASRHLCLLLLAASAWPAVCLASFGGSLDLKPEFMFWAAAVIALPTGVFCVLAEAILPRRRPPGWLTIASAIAALIAFGVAFGRFNLAVAALFVLPPLATLALRGLVPRTLTRLAVGIVISILVVLILRARLSTGLGLGLVPKDHLPELAGGAMTCLGLWTLCVLILWRNGWTPTLLSPAPVLPALAAVVPTSFRSWSDLGPRLSAWFEASLSRRRGVGWWMAIALVLYLGIGLVISVGGLRDGAFIQHQVWAITEFFGFRALPTKAAPLWWLFGLPWSLLVAGAAWGIAAAAGAFDPGRLSVLRLPVIVLGGLLLLWTAQVAWNIHTVWSAEEEISRVR